MTGRAVPDPGDPAGALLALMARLEPELAPEAVLAALDQAAARPDGRRRIAAAVTGQPELLTGQGARAPLPAILRFISALARAGAATVVEPPCPRCGRQRQLGNPVDGLRVCGGCRSKARALRCGRCGKVRSIARRNDGGKPICQNCWHRDPRSWKPCTECGNNRRVAAVTQAGPVCQSCRPGPDLPCSICQSGDGGRIGISRATGTPVCERCRKRWITCSRCGTGAPHKGGTLRQPLCARCLNPDPAFWKRCASCQQTWQLSAAECTRCSLDRKLSHILTPPDSTAAVLELDLLRAALVGVDRPDLMLDWLKNPGVRRTLRAVAACDVITHEALDTLPPGLTLVHLRSMMVAAGALPARDERFTARETWISQVIAALADPGHRQALRGYALWHQLRRLRGRLDGRAASRDQVKNVRDQVTAAAAFLDWLTARGLTLGSCTQGLLVLLYAQKLTAITALTTWHVQREDGHTLLRLGSRPVILPAPLDNLVAGLATGRRRPGSSLLDVPTPWLFPGRHPGTALTPDALGLRLHALGISPRQGRSTALLTLAAEVPAAIVAKTLGIHVQVAIQWQKISAGDWAAYAADITRRHGIPGSAIVAGEPR